MESQPKK
jgi:pyrrolidone-carboxylate peptidase